MEVVISKLMRPLVVVLHENQSVQYAKSLMDRHQLPFIPVVNPHNILSGIVTAASLNACYSDFTLLNQVMERDPISIPNYTGVSVAARVMRNYRQTALVVTDNHKVPLGVITTSDLLKLLEAPRFQSWRKPELLSRKNRLRMFLGL